MTNNHLVLAVAGPFILFAGTLAFISTLVGQKQRAWTSHYAELVSLIEQCPDQHTAVKQALGDEKLQLNEARTLIYECSTEALRAAVN